MKILDIENVGIIKKTNLFSKDENNREINLYELVDVLITGESISYPNTLLYDINNDIIINPVNETTMSLKTIKETKVFNNQNKNFKKTEDKTVFFYIYNFDNYYHFIYDSLPYLISYIDCRKTNKDIKLLMYYPYGKDYFYRFVTEFLEILNINNDDIIIANEDTLYKKIIVSSSYTHGVDSNLPPRKEIYEQYQKIVKKIKPESFNTPKKIYVSRRSWLHGDVSNIGTNYTLRRKLVNEDELVEILIKKGYSEVFTENLTTIEKIAMFANAEIVVGPIGGGICNVLFSNNNCKLTAIVSPYFLDVNQRFVHSFKNVDVFYFMESENLEKDEFKKYMRVKCDELVGEIIQVDSDEIKILYSDTKISGWNSDTEYKVMTKQKGRCTKLDNGLNSSWRINLNEIKKIL
jgi:hypothetical protein